MKTELGLKKKINEILRREPSTLHIMETLSSSISTMPGSEYNKGY